MARAWIDGRLLATGEPAVSEAPGVFETLRTERGALFFLQEHLARLERGARTLGLAWPPPFEPARALQELVGALDLEPAALRLEWTPPRLAVHAREIAVPDRPLCARLAAPGEIALPRPAGVKTTQRAAYDHARAAARARGDFEVLVRAADGALVEGTVTNLFLALDGELVTPPLENGALPGIVRGAILTQLEREPLRDARGREWRARERRLELADLRAAQEVLLTSSVQRVLALERWAGPDGVSADLPGAGGPVAEALTGRVLAVERASPGFRRAARG